MTTRELVRVIPCCRTRQRGVFAQDAFAVDCSDMDASDTALSEPPTKRHCHDKPVTEDVEHLFNIHLTAHSQDLYSEICGLQIQLAKHEQDQKDCDVQDTLVLQDLLGPALTGSHQSENLLSPDVCIQRLLDVTRNAHECSCLLTAEQKVQLNIVKSLFKSLKEQHPGRWSEVTGRLTKECLPLEMLWQFHVDDILSLQSFLDGALRDREWCKHLTKQLLQLCKTPKNELSHKLLSAFCSHLVQNGFPGKKSDDSVFKKMCIGVLDGVTRGLLDGSMAEMELLLHTDLWSSVPDISHVSFKKYCTHTISLVMSHRSNMKVSDALKRQAEWKSGKIPENYKVLYKQLLVPFESSEVVQMLRRILEKQEVNWQTLLSFIATFLVCFSSAAADIQDHIKRLLNESLEMTDMENTVVAFLLARQSCLEGAHVFPAYAQWFQEMFSDATKSPAGSKKAFTFFMKFLTDLVPYEPADVLKVHILRPPAVPAKCRDLWTDYILLAKTRLADLKVPLEETNSSIYSNQGNSAAQDKKGLQDVEKAIAVFESSGKLPTTVMEASIFRKPYFVGKFLPALLLPRHLPDVPDSKMKFIEALKKAGKIPSSLFAKYEEACKQETRLLLEGVFDVEEDDGVEEMMMGPLEQLTHRLKQLLDAVISQSKENKISEIVSILSEKIGAIVCPEDDMPQVDQPCVIDLCQPNLSASYVQVVDEVLNCICRTWHSSRDTLQQSWLCQLIQMLSQHHALLPTLFTRLLTLFSCKDISLSQHHVEGIAAFIFHLVSNTTLFPPLAVRGHGPNTAETEYVSFLPLFLQHLPITTETEMVLAHWFLAEYLKTVFLCQSANPDIISDRATILPRQLVVMFCLLSWRILPETLPSHCQSHPGQHLNIGCQEMAMDAEQDHVESVVRSLFGSEEFQTVLKDNQPAIEDWLDFELRVVPVMDTLSPLQRQTHLYCIMSHFAVTPKANSSPDDDTDSSSLMESCSVLFKVIVRALSRSQTGPAKCSKCGNTVQTTTSGAPVNSEAVGDLLTLLSKMVQNLPASTDSEETTGPSLIQWVSQLISLPSQEGETIVPQAVLRVLLSCPPHLLFTNSANEEPSKKSVMDTVQVLEDFLLPQVCEGVLSLDVICHLLQGYVTVSKNCTDKRVMKIFEDHPLIVLSTLVHWHSVSSLVPTLKSDSSLWNKLSLFLDTLDRNYKYGQIDTMQVYGDPFCLAAAVYTSLLHRDWICSTEVIKALIVQIHTFQPKAVLFLSKLLLASMSDSHICSSRLSPKMERRQQWLSELWELFPYLIGPSVDDSQPKFLTVQRSWLSPDCLPFRDIACLRCMSTLAADRIAGEKDVVQATVHLFARLCQRFEDPPTAQPQTSMGVFLELSKSVLNLVKAAPLHMLQTVHSDDAKQCGLEIFVVYQQRIKSER